MEDIGPDGTPVTTREIAGVTVTISTAGDTEMMAHTYFGSLGAFQGAGLVANAPLHPEFVSGTRFISAPFIDSAQPIIFDFSQPVVGFGLTTVDLLENGAPSGHFVRLEARNASGEVVAAQTLTGPQGPTGLDIHWYLSSNKPEITQVILSSNISGHGPGYGIDDLRLQVAPVTTNLIDANHGAGAGSFEVGTLVHNGQAPNGLGWMHVAPGDGTTIKGWTVGGPGNGVDWLIAPTFRPDSGTRSIDLQHTSSSSIATTIPTVIGQVYELSFGAAAVLGPIYNNNGIVSAGSLLNQPFAADFSDSLSTQTYKPFTFLFTATEPTTTLRFQAVGPGFYGPVIDSVSVREMSPNLIDATYGIGAGSFEFGTFGEGTGWSASGNVGVAWEGRDPCCVPSEGLFFANFNGGETVPNGQLATVLPTTPGARYLLEFDFGKGGTGTGTASLNVTVVGDQVVLNETVSDNTGGSPGQYSRFSFVFIADRLDLTLTFTDVSNGTISFDALLDAVSVVELSGAPEDTEPPVLTLPGDLTAEATGPTGAVVTYTAFAMDEVDGPITPDCEPASGSTFALGTTTVTCTATDAAGNSASGSFTVTVFDATPPVLTLPAAIAVEATGPSGATVEYTASAIDEVDGEVIPTCTPASGSTFPLGDTIIACTATDQAGNSASGSFTVTVIDTTPPTLVCPPDLTVIQGQPINLGTPTVADVVDANPTVTSDAPASFPLGMTTMITWTATDASGNSATCTQQVTVEADPVPNQPPVADAGPDQVARQGSLVTLSGSGSDSDNGPAPLAFAWTQTGGPGVSLNGINTATPTFTPAASGLYTFALVVNDGADNSLPDSVRITVPLLGDIDLDGDVDSDDLNLLLAARNTPASGPNDLRDLNGDGTINALDARRLVLLCTRPRCATE